ncbi:MAG TPA: hypothetical protein VEM95_00425, partial [Thermoplasmata archaeon]|nr:hypothetical protein [Thermoplasmata archaeon]
RTLQLGNDSTRHDMVKLAEIPNRLIGPLDGPGHSESQLLLDFSVIGRAPGTEVQTRIQQSDSEGRGVRALLVTLGNEGEELVEQLVVGLAGIRLQAR